MIHSHNGPSIHGSKCSGSRQPHVGSLSHYWLLLQSRQERPQRYPRNRSGTRKHASCVISAPRFSSEPTIEEPIIRLKFSVSHSSTCMRYQHQAYIFQGAVDEAGWLRPNMGEVKVAFQRKRNAEDFDDLAKMRSYVPLFPYN